MGKKEQMIELVKMFIEMDEKHIDEIYSSEDSLDYRLGYKMGADAVLRDLKVILKTLEK